MTNKLIYKTKLKAVLLGVPGRDLTAEEVEKYGGEKYLISTGLYEKPKKKGGDGE